MRLACLMMLCLAAAPVLAADCSGSTVPQPLPARNAPVAPLSPQFAGSPHGLLAPTGLLGAVRDESLAVDVVLLRLRQENCAPGVDEFADYKPKTEFDNTPYRFDMNQNGKRMSADDFDAWMKARGIRIVNGRAVRTVSEAPPAAATVSE